MNAMTNAERQALYRQRRRQAIDLAIESYRRIIEQAERELAEYESGTRRDSTRVGGGEWIDVTAERAEACRSTIAQYKQLLKVSEKVRGE